MPTSERAYYRAMRRGENLLRTFASDVRDARLTAGLSQREVGRRVGWSAATVSRIEGGATKALDLIDAVVLADAVGLDLSVKTYPGRALVRDAPQAKRLGRLLRHVGTPLSYRLEAVLPARDGRIERRAWDALISEPNAGETGVELEQRLYDVQAQTRRILLKWRDSQVERLLLVIADTHGNRRVIHEFPEYFAELRRLGTAKVLATLEAGLRPPTGYMLF